jgi:hypothetical protein
MAFSLTPGVIRNTADRDDERVVAQHARWNDRLAVLVEARRDIDLPHRAVEADHRSNPIAVKALAGVSDQFEGVLFTIQRPGCDFVQQRFPNVNTRMIEQRDRCFVAATQRGAKKRRQTKSGRAAADNENAMQRRVAGRDGLRDVRERWAWHRMSSRVLCRRRGRVIAAEYRFVGMESLDTM